MNHLPTQVVYVSQTIAECRVMVLWNNSKIDGIGKY